MVPTTGKSGRRVDWRDEELGDLVWVKRGVWVLVIALVAFGVYRGRALLAARGSANKAPTYATVTVSRGAVTETVSDPGTIAAATSASVAAQVTGHATAVNVKVGQTVKAGDVLVKLSDDQGLAAAVANAHAALAQAEAQLQSDVNPAANVTPAQVQSAQIQVQQAKLSLQQQEDAIAKLNVKAPFVGAVQTVAVTPGQQVSGGETLGTFVDMSKAWAVVQVLESDLTKVAVGNGASVTIVGTGATVEGNVVQIGNTPTAGKSGSTFPVTIAVPSPTDTFVNGMTALARIGAGPDTPGINDYVSATGTLTYPNVVNLKAQQSGTVKSVPTVGQHAAAGDVLFAETNPDLQAQLAQSQLTVKSDEDNLANVKNPAPASAATIAAQRAQIASLQAALNVKEQQYGYLTLTAPISGEVTAVNVVPGDEVQAGTTLVTLLDPNGLEAQIPVDELDVSKLKVGQNAQIQVNALPGKTYNGKITLISPVAKTSNGVSTYEVDISMPPAAELLTGMSLTASIQVATVPNVVRVPGEAVQAVNGRSLVYVIGADGTPSPRPVKTGVVGDRWTQIDSGLQPGQTIVVAFAQSSSGTNPGRAMFFLGGGDRGQRGGRARGGGG